MKERNVRNTGFRVILSLATALFFSLNLSTAQVVLKVESENIDKGDTVTLDITTDAFQGVASIQLSHNFDSTVLEFVDVVNVNSSLIGLSAQGPGGTIKNGEIVANWFSQSGGTVNLSNGSTLYALRFVGIGNQCDSSDVIISNSPRKIEILDDDLEELAFEVEDGLVVINGTDCISLPDVTFRLNENSGLTGTEICLQLRVDGFEEIEAFQWSMKWDQSIATFSRVASLNLVSLTTGSFNFDAGNQALICIWDDVNGNAITLPNATRIADICFNLIGSPGEMTDVNFSSSPLAIEVSRKDEPDPVPTTTQKGKLTINQTGGKVIQLIACDATGPVKTDICIPIKVVNFIDVGSFQFSFTFTTDVELAMINSRNHALAGFGTDKVTSPTPGVVRTLWTDLGGGCKTLPDSTVLFELCLTSETQGDYDIDFSNVPLRQEFTDCDGFELDHKTVGPGILHVTSGGSEDVVATLGDTLSVRCATRCRGVISINASGGSGNYVYKWFENGVKRDDLTLKNAGELCGGLYTIIVCDADDPNNADTVIVSLRKPEKITINEQITGATVGCNGSIMLTVGGGTPQFFYRWSDPDNQVSNPAINLCKGKYNCTIADSENCAFITDTFVVSGAPIVIQEPKITLPKCFAGCDGEIDITAEGGCGPLTYTWTGNVVTPNSEDQKDLCAGSYKVVVTDTSGGMAMMTIFVDQPDVLKIQVDSIQNGNPGGIFVTISGGTGTYTIKWTDSVPNLVSQSEDATNLAPGTYNIMVTDENGCISMKSYVITSMGLLVTVNLSATPGRTNVTCNGECDGTADVIVSQGSGAYSYQWSHDPQETSSMIDELCAGTYIVTVQDMGSGSTTVTSFDITEPDILSVTVIDMECASGPGIADGAYRATPVGGSAPYNYLWCNNSTSAVPTNLVGGANCNVLVTDANGCQVFEDGFIICDDMVPPGDCDECFEGRDVITPNGDGMNETLTICCIDDPRFQDNRLFIYNRRGQLVNEYVNYNNQWGGTDEGGNLLTEDAYMWVLSVTLPTGQRDIYRGTVTVILFN